MGIPSPFEVSRHIGNNLNRSFNRVKDENAIERILSDAIQTDDPAKLQGTIGKILSQVSPERQGAAIQYLQNAYANVQANKERDRQTQAAMQAGVTPGLNPTVQAQQLRNQQPPKPTQPLGGLSGQAVPDEIANAIPGILDRNKNSSADELAVAFDEAKIPRAYSNSYIENRRRKDEAKKPGDEFANIREKSVADYVNNAINQGQDAENLRYSIEQSRKAINGEIAGPGVEALAKNDPYFQLLVGLTPDEATLQATNKKLLEGSKGIFGSKPTEREIFLLLNSMLPSIGKSKEANLAGLNFIERINDLKLMHADIVDELTEGGTKYIPDLERKVNARMRPYGEKLRNEMSQAVNALKTIESSSKSTSNSGKIIVKAPDGSRWEMTQDQIDDAAKQGVNFEPVK